MAQIPPPRMQRQSYFYKARLVYTVISRPARAMQCEWRLLLYTTHTHRHTLYQHMTDHPATAASMRLLTLSKIRRLY